MLLRGSGVLLPISSLPSAHGIGDLGPESYRFADLLVNASQTYWQVLPLNPTDTGFYNSPYLTTSTTAGNPLLISLEKLEERGFQCDSSSQISNFCKNSVDYEKVTLFKYRCFHELFTKYTTTIENDTAFKRFCIEQRHWLDDYALFMALKHRFNGQSWNKWPEQFKYRFPGALEAASLESSTEITREKWYQYLFFNQWTELKSYCNSKGIVIIGDIPIYVSYDSVDVWMHPELFKLDENLKPLKVSGVPPDYFSATGQLWNNPVYNWNAIEKNGFTWWIDRMKNIFARFDIVRIDHFRGLVKYWEIPIGSKTAMNGSWEPVPTYKLFDTLKKELGSFSVIAEDLGIITEDVKDAINYYGFPGMKVLLFAFGEDNPLHPYLPHMYTNNCVVYTGTHDNNTILGWFENEADQASKERFYKYAGITDRSPDSIVWTMIKLAQNSIADCVIIPVQDLLFLGTEHRMNTPAKANGNWKWRMTKKQMKTFPVLQLKKMTERYDRSHKNDS